MSIRNVLFALFLGILLMPRPARAERNAVHHDLTVTLSPTEHHLSVIDTLTLPAGTGEDLTFVLHAGLKPESATPGVKITKEASAARSVPVEVYRVRLPAGVRTFRLQYRGAIDHPLETSGAEQARGFQDSPGLITSDGVVLSGKTNWYPDPGTGLMTFDLAVTLPEKWDAVSQGERTLHELKKKKTTVRWQSSEPQDEIYLVAAKFVEYDKPAGHAEAMAFLRAPDPGLAAKYLDATTSYLALYDRLIGPYPYKKFALVENFWETGFGMPSFTLLGSKIIRLPFIINTSYPHEILHNWWGNSVFPDFENGNWSEGLTAYLADHLMKEQQGGGAEYRLQALQKYADYVLGGRDFPLTQFRTRHSSSSEAIGYGKALMFFHMLRLELGDEAFRQGIRRFYRDFRFRVAGFEDLRTSFGAATGKDLSQEFEQWVTRTGAPTLRVSDAKALAVQDGFILSARLEQTQPGEAYHLRVPVAVTMGGKDTAFQAVVEMKDKKLEMNLRVPGRPVRLDIDPEFDLFRRLDREEIPPALSQALGAKKMLILLPSSAPMELLQAYRAFAASIGRSGPDEVEVKLDTEVAVLPGDRAVTLLGWENLFVKEATVNLSGYDVLVSPQAVRISQTEIGRSGHAFVFSARLPKNRDLALLFIAADHADALPGLGQKLPHYHKYSYLAFEGAEPANVAKGRWPVVDSPLTVLLPDVDGKVRKVEMGKLAAREPLAALPPVFSKDTMMETVRYLSGKELEGRGFGSRGLDKAADRIAEQFKLAGLMPAGDQDGSWFQSWEDSGGEPQRKAVMKNVIGIIPGKDPAMQGQSVVIGAHYDHLGLGWPEAREDQKGKVHPGADDNASGVAVLVELARVLAKAPQPERTIVFVAFTGEEAGKRGSQHYVLNEKNYPTDKCIGMVNLDTVGRLGKGKLLVLGAGSAKEWVHIFRGAGFVTGVDIETVSEELDSSDQKSFQEKGVPAVQLFSGPNADYHRATDTFDKIDAEGLVKVASVAKEAVEYLAGRSEPLTGPGAAPAAAQASTKTERKVSLGTIPDFAYQGKGFRLSGVVAGSPAEAAGMKEGDVIIKVNASPIGGLKDFSDVLKTLKPGDRASIIFLRSEKEMKVDAVVKGR
jgi:aminopeptidase N